MVTEVVESRIDIVTANAGISWRAILGGAVVMAAIGFVLTVLGAGFGLSSLSPWPGQSASATKFAIMGGVWLIIVQWASAGIGGYMAGRLGPRTAALHIHEVHFRNTARGIIAWGLALVVTATLLASGMSTLLGSTAQGAANIVASVGQGAAQGSSQGAAQNPDRPSGYLVDTLFRKSTPDANASAQVARGEATRIIATGIKNGDVAQPDRAYLAQLVAARTGLSQDDAQKRVDDVIAKAKQAEQQAREAADAARKTARDVAFFIAFSSLIGAFIAGVAGNIGGHHRDALVYPD
jgi:hypothetical protein